MDLGLTGEIEEVNEGDEPPTFWEAALGINGRVTSPKWSDHWTLRGTPDHYRYRLFRIELENPRPAASFWSRRASSPAKAAKSGLAQEITPFCQRDLEASHIFVLDAYFEIFVFVGDQASSKHAEFVTALFFAQEYSILAASLQDRPLVPRCHVALSEAPPDFQTVFRKWTPTPRKSQGGHPITIPLSAAIEALA
jgi:Gelsolin repeat